MNSINVVVILILAIYAGLAQLDAISIQIGPYSPLFAGAFTGLMLGDVQTGLFVGATLQLATLGVATYGGATVPDFLSGSIMGTAFAIISGEGPEYGIGLAVPIGLLLTQLDIFGRMTNVIFQHKADKAAANGDVKGVELANILGTLPWSLTRFLPVFLGLFFGEALVMAINEYIPAWLMTGLRSAGGIIPAMGIAILMRYLPIRKFFPYYIIGFVLMAYASSIFSILSISLIGFAFAAIYISNKRAFSGNRAVNTGADDMEVEIDE